MLEKRADGLGQPSLEGRSSNPTRSPKQQLTFAPVPRAGGTDNHRTDDYPDGDCCGSFFLVPRRAGLDGGGTTGPMSPSGASSRSTITGA